ncbi:MULTISPECIES: hypothetical protein [unclassified Microbacterium]|uniref:hypothetical protein n=1 Tax=unclassified Microbacterium TaxID=2609290 RepID=UPI0028833FAD|nr:MULTISPECIES: hypothetical protein [unclassified Microbacterium]
MNIEDEIDSILDRTLYIRPELERATSSRWRPFAVDRAPKPLPESSPFTHVFGPHVTIDGDEETGRVHIYNEEYEVEVVGQPGGDLTVPGVDRHTDLDYWLRKVHARYWEFAADLNRVAHEKNDALAAGTEPLPEPGQPRLYAPDFRVPVPEWVTAGVTIHLNEVEELDTEESRYFDVFEVDHSEHHVHLGFLLISHDGHINAFLNEGVVAEELRPAATKALTQMGAARFARDIMHSHLHIIVNGAILGIDNEMVARTGWRN